MRIKLYTKTHTLSDQKVMDVMAGDQVVTKTEYMFEIRYHWLGITVKDYLSNVNPDFLGYYNEYFGFRPSTFLPRLQTPSWLLIRWRDKWQLSEKYWFYKAKIYAEKNYIDKKQSYYLYRDGCYGDYMECKLQFWESIKLRLQCKI